SLLMAAFGFTPASQQDVFSIETGQSSSKTVSVLSGEEARQFYENLINDGTRQDGSRRATSKKNGREHHMRQKNRESSRRLRRRVRAAGAQQSPTDSEVHRGIRGEGEDDQRRDTSTSERSAELKGLRLLRCAHEGDVSGIKELDTFFWTAVMCASWSGQKTALSFLLDHGAAWVGVVDTQGRDAKDLAQEGIKVISMSFINSTKAPQNSTYFLCFFSSHLSSTLHQFSLRRPPPAPYYCLPPSSNSYKMMVRCGWKPGTGLGPEGEGPKQPVPTVLKRDQKGLGYGQMTRAKVTHFKARDGDAVKPLPRENEERGRREQRKEETKKKEQKDKNWERDFRTSFYL
uniref:G-patch domain and ankyrin repeats 1 n=1 Tax=Acanthochromis polyacanthus TaxID=80966 RepID=A0A3Q1F622_9TELE